MKKDFFFTADDSHSRLDVFLHEKLGDSRTYIQEQIRKGVVRINQSTIVKPSHRLTAGDRVSGAFEAIEDSGLEAVPYALDVLHEDEDLLCINKPQDVVIHPASGYKGPTLVHYLLYHFKNHPGFKDLKEGRPGIVHRLDRGTSGVLLIAKNRKSQDLLSQLFKGRLIQKEYEAVVWGKAPRKGHVENTIGRDRKDRKKMSTNCESGRRAITDFSLITESHTFSHVGLFPKTGRTHQLRVHLSESRLPIVGDQLYGPKSLKNRVEKLNPLLQTAVEGMAFTLLHAKRLTFRHPMTGADLTVEAPRPGVFDKFLALMKQFDAAKPGTL